MGFGNRLLRGIEKGVSGDASNRQTEELAASPDSPNPRSVGNATGTTGWSSVFGNRDNAADTIPTNKKEMRKHWNLFRTVPLVREPITAFSAEVVGDGYWVEADSDEAREELEEWAQECAIVSGKYDQDIQSLLKRIVIQEEVRAATLIEHVGTKRNSDELVALKLINPETVKAQTRPNQNVLLRPEDTDVEGVKLTDENEAAAFIQYDNAFSRFDDREEQRFPLSRVTKTERDSDVGGLWGESRLTACSDRIESLVQKLNSNDTAIESKAWPFWMFLFGTEEYPWTSDEIDDFMEEHSAEEYGPGKKQGVAGDVDIKTISGEVAEIADSLKFDVNWIMSTMPMPKYALGSFEENINQFVTKGQQNRLDQQVEDARRELSEDLTPIFRKKAKQMGYSAKDVQFHVGQSPEEAEKELERKMKQARAEKGKSLEPQEPPAMNGGDEPSNESDPNDTGDGEQPIKETGTPDQIQDDGEPDNESTTEDNAMLSESTGAASAVADGCGCQTPSSGVEWSEQLDSASVWDLDEEAMLHVELQDLHVEELADSRLVSTEPEYRAMTRVVRETLLDVKGQIVGSIESSDELSPDAEGRQRIRELESLIDRVVEGTLAVGALTGSVRPVMDDVAEKLVTQLGQPPFDLDVTRSVGMVQRDLGAYYAERTATEIKDVGEELTTRLKRQIRLGIERDESVDVIAQRLEDSFSDDAIRKRSKLIARMETQNALEGMKYDEFEANSEVIGVKLINPCTSQTTPLCRSLACGGSTTVAYFDDDAGTGEQFTGEAPDAAMFKQFSPLPKHPPFHWACRTESIPVTRSG